MLFIMRLYCINLRCLFLEILRKVIKKNYIEVNMSDENYPLDVEYCGLCGLPPEYCEYGSEPDKCKEWLKENIPDLYEDLVKQVEGNFNMVFFSRSVTKKSRFIFLFCIFIYLFCTATTPYDASRNISNRP